ncbi:MAG: hypothetical protein ACM3JE_02870 [Betaproteobacteria bacterium]
MQNLRTVIFVMLIISLMSVGLIYSGPISFSIAAVAKINANLTTPSTATASTTPKYIVLAWNDLGMHCYNPDYKNLCILPPYNTLWAQVIKVGNPPTLVSSGIEVFYNVPGNTYSTDKWPFQNKTNFWTYTPDLFNVNLPNNIGLAGNGLSGKMTLNGDHFEAKGIPITEYTDNSAKNPDATKWSASCFQLASVIVINSTTGKELTRTSPTIPASTELNCASCHSDDGDATTRYSITPTGNVDTNILAIHDYLNPTINPPLSQQTPVLCANCHSDNALGMTGVTGVKSLSNAMHKHHFSASIMDITLDTNGCYSCHPGEKTQCLRDVMSTTYKLSCVDCHGNLGTVSQNTDPWLSEPSCDNPNCHGSSYALNNPLFRFSSGHGNIYCEGCHGSTHAISPSKVSNDDVRFVALQGSVGPLKTCTVCHETTPETAFKHQVGAVYQNDTAPLPPTSVSNNQNQSSPTSQLTSTVAIIATPILFSAALAFITVRKHKKQAML